MEKRNFIMFGVLGALLLIFCAGLTSTVDKNSPDINQMGNQLNLSGFWEISPILIDNSGVEGITWEEALNEPWCNGLGTSEDPYVIENITINGNGVGDCLLIQNSIAYFIIRNCTFYNSGVTNSPAVEAGIKLNNVDNGQLVNNTCYSNGNGIKLTESNNIIIIENIVYDNAWWGIDFGWFHESGNYSVISRNIVKNNFAGISGASSGYECTANLISDNEVDSNTHYGIILGDICHDNIVTGNNVSNNGFGGIGAAGITLGGHDNLVYLNNLNGNYRNSKDLGINNQWDNGTIGNYWDDYGGVDFDDDGIGDTPYLIYGSAGSQDNFPIWDDGDDPPFDITVDASGISTNIKIDGFPYIGIGGEVTYILEEGTYPIYSYPGGLIASFNVEASGSISYDPQYEGKILLGSGTPELKIIGFPIEINTIGVSTNVTIFGLTTWLPFREIEVVNLPFNVELKLFVGLGGITVGLLPNATFTVTNEGMVSYDPLFDGLTLNGLGTPSLEVIGYPIDIDTRGVSTNITLFGLKYWLTYQGVDRLFLPPDTENPYKILAGLGGWSLGLLPNASFSVNKEGEVSYDPIFNGKTLNGLGTPSLEVIGYPIDIDTRGVTTNITLFGLKYWLEYKAVERLYLPPDPENSYKVQAGLGGWSLGLLPNASFTVNKEGEVSYDPVFNNKTLDGLGTSTVQIIGYPINIDMGRVTTNITLFGLKYWLEYKAVETVYLPPDPANNYNIQAGLGEMSIGILPNASFTVNKVGEVTYNPIFDGGTLNGLGTSTLEIIGHPITIDVSEANSYIALFGMYDYIEYGGSETFYLPPDTAIPYRILSDLGGILEETFIVRKDGTVDPTEIIYEHGIIRLYSDIIPPTTSISLSGTVGNNGWYLSDVDVILTAADPSGIERTEYSLDGINWIEYSGPFSIITEGMSTLQYRSIDSIGNVEDINSLDVNVDKSPPETEIAMSSYYIDSIGEIFVSPTTQFTLSATDQISALETIYYRIDGGIWLEYTEDFTLIGINGPHIIEYYSIDIAGNEEPTNILMVNLVNLEITSYLSKGEDNPITQFDVIFTKDKQTGEFKLVATNPGNMFYIIELFNSWPTSIETLDLVVIIPGDFLLKGSEPIHVYLDEVDITSSCMINGNLITIQDIPPESVIKVVIHLEYGLKGNIYGSLEEFGMVGYVFDAVISGVSDQGLEQSLYNSATLITHQKKTTAIAGYVHDLFGHPIEGALVELCLNGVPIKSILTDEKGFYYFIDIPVGVYEVRVNIGSISEMQVAVTSKDELTEVDFEIAYENP